MDSGNLSKSVFGALEGVVYHNDSQIRAVVQMVNRTRIKQFMTASFHVVTDWDLADKENLISKTTSLALSRHESFRETF